MQNKRNIWIDGVKIISCILVVLGHFFQSMIKSDILPANNVYQWFNQTIYFFHVQLFFICSGYLYQRYSKVDSLQTWWENIKKKGITLGVPYFVFSTVTWLLKMIFSKSVNNQMGGLFQTLFLAPTAPYWFLYTLFFLFLFTPTFTNKKMAQIILSIAIILKCLNIFGVDVGIYAIDSIFIYEVWFVFGMLIAKTAVDDRIGKQLGMKAGMTLIALFLALSVYFYACQISFWGSSFFMGSLACAAVILIMISIFPGNRVLVYLAQATMPVFLMHTIFAAPVRIVLMRLGIESVAVHIMAGLFISFIGPIAAAEIMKHFKWLEIFVYPGKYIRLDSGADKCEKTNL